MNCVSKRVDAVLYPGRSWAMLSVCAVHSQVNCMISWKVTILEGCGCVSSWHSRSCCHCCVDSSVSRGYLSVLVKPICLAAFQNKHLVFGVGRLVFVGPTLCKTHARIYGAWLSLTWNTTKRYCWCYETFPNEGGSHLKISQDPG